MTTKTTKQMLIELYEEERTQNRCTLVHGLKEQAEKAVIPFTTALEALNEKSNELDKKHSKLRSQQRDKIEERDNHLRKEKLFNFTSKSCSDAIHSDLVAFDTETRDHIRDILEK